MPRYFFHLRFGRRFLPDDEGIELRNRTAARDEALAVVRDLTNPRIKVGRQRWASWFLEVADERSAFFRTPIGHPALELVTPDRHAPGGAELELTPVADSALLEEAHAGGRTAEIVRQTAALHQRRAQLLKKNEQLRSELLSLRSVTEALLVRSQRLVSLARGAVAALLAVSVMTTAQTGTLLSTVC
jgi:hypothetical protein